MAKMWPSLSLLCVLVAFASARSIPYFPPLSDDLVNHINKLNTTWKVSTGMIWGFLGGMHCWQAPRGIQWLSFGSVTTAVTSIQPWTDGCISAWKS